MLGLTKNKWKDISEIPAYTDLSERISKDLYSVLPPAGNRSDK